jgi:hypothetical protein
VRYVDLAKLDFSKVDRVLLDGWPLGSRDDV